MIEIIPNLHPVFVHFTVALFSIAVCLHAVAYFFKRVKIISGLIFISVTFYAGNAWAKNQEVDLVVGYKTVNFAGKAIKAIAVNNQIPAPTLHFKEGDEVTINVHNQLDEETSIHWHGIILPWQMDGVVGVTQSGISPGKVFSYKFTMHQSGTYWYHAHAGLQEQLGVYGAFLIDPIQRSNYKYTKDYAIVLSDWSNTEPNKILANLKKEGDYYSSRLPLQPSLLKFMQDYNKASIEERKQLANDYSMMQQMRMGIYDFSDIKYDEFLLNGHPSTAPWTAMVKVDDVVRLRFIGAGGSTIFHVKIPGSDMQMIHVQGNDVVPHEISDFTIAPGETYDVLVKIQKKSPYIIYAESIDTAGAAYGALVTTAHQVVNYKKVMPFPEPLPVTREMMAHDMPTEPRVIGDALLPYNLDPIQTTTGTKYHNLTAATKSNDPNKPIKGIIKMELFGYMGRFIWFINGVPEHKAEPIIVEPGKRYRIVFTNSSMMHHPMHIHGHWFILRKGNGAYDPLLHTIDVPPGATITTDLDADASGQWLFHCHLLYHMMTGMSRVFQYSTLIDITKGEAKPQNVAEKTPYNNRPIVRIDEIAPINVSLVKHHTAHQMQTNFATLLDVGIDPFHDLFKFTYKGLYGGDYNKLELSIHEAEIKRGKIENADIDIFGWHLLDQFWTIKGGVNYFYRPAKKPYWQPGIGVEGLMPWFIDTDVRGYYYKGSAKVDAELSRDTQITNNFYITAGIRSILATKTVSSAEVGSGLNQMRYIITPYYSLMPGLNLFAEFEHGKSYGEHASFQREAGGSAIKNTITFGVSTLF